MIINIDYFYFLIIFPNDWIPKIDKWKILYSINHSINFISFNTYASWNWNHGYVTIYRFEVR